MVPLGFPTVSTWTLLSPQCFTPMQHCSIKILIARIEFRPAELMGKFPELHPGAPQYIITQCQQSPEDLKLNL
ncbi:hypothetical protein WISP_65683 [Willisornis vidua]|uniref:Uncharacterized protein n=1 Tax=Willisornis vidua TaxID=1566151 RepID=A0ABQ9DF00_9PASS|nr:hypothetical protein WISP_65683 [Willisornis vidua]